MFVTLILAGVAAALFLAFVFYFSWNFDYWAKRGVPSCNPFSVFGDRTGGLPFGKPFYKLLDPIYEKFKGKHRFVGTFQARRPILVLMDPDLVKVVLTKEFNTFQGRGQPIDEEGDPLSANLFNLEGPRWKNLRSKLSPVFTSGKLRMMFPLMTDIGQKLDDRMSDLVKRPGAGGEVEMRDLLLRYSTDVIGSVAFGITCNSLQEDTPSEFHKMTREVFSQNFLFLVRFFLVSIHPVFVKLMPFKSLFYKTTNFFLALMKETVEFREKNEVDRNDLVKLMMQLREADRLETDRVNHIEFNENVMAGQAFLFFIAGLDNIANSVGFALHELALDPVLQQRAADEVRACMKKNGGMTYEAVKEMDLIERIMREVLRKYSPVGLLTREPNTNFQLPDTDVVVDKTVMVWIPVWQMLHDPALFPDPERFDPDRFTEEAKQQRHQYSYLPFGEGPRFCIAERFAILEMKLCIAELIEKHVFSVGTKTDLSLKFNPKVFSPSPVNGFWLKVDTRPRPRD